MIKKIVFSLLFVCLCIAIPLAIAGYTKVELGKSGLALLNITARDLENFKIEIPDIPAIPKFNVDNGAVLVLNFLIDIVNGLSTLINFIVDILNIVIQFIQYVVILIKNIITFKDSLIQATSNDWSLSILSF